MLVPDSVLDDLAADLALVRGYAAHATIDVSTLYEPGIAGTANVIKATPWPVSEQGSDESTPRLENLVLAAGFFGFAASRFAARNSKSKKLWSR